MILFFTILSTCLLLAWIIQPLWAPKNDGQAACTPEIERLAGVLKALRDLGDDDETADVDRDRIRHRLEKDRDALQQEVAPEGVRLCEQCDTLAIGMATFCWNCGIRLEDEMPKKVDSPVEQKHSCPECKKPCEGDFSFCPHCGTSLQASDKQ